MLSEASSPAGPDGRSHGSFPLLKQVQAEYRTGAVLIYWDRHDDTWPGTCDAGGTSRAEKHLRAGPWASELEVSRGGLGNLLIPCSRCLLGCWL